MEALMQDLKYGVRMLLKSPAFTVVAVVTLALGIGANSAIFSLVNAVLLESMAAEKPGELVRVSTSTAEGPHYDFSYPLYVDFRDRNEVFSGLIAYGDAVFGLAVGDRTDRVSGEFVSSNYFPVLGVQPMMGRGFSGSEELQGSPAVAVISYGLWQRQLSGDPSVIGKTISLNGRTFSVIGVAPRQFHGVIQGFSSEVWITLPRFAELDKNPGVMQRRTTSWLELMARSKPGVTLEQAQARMTAVARAFEVDTDSKNWAVGLQPAGRGNDYMVAALERPLKLLMWAVALVLLIASANVANLLLARAKAREKEIGIRQALGASRARIVRQLFTESFLLAAVGGVAGIMVAVWLTDLAGALRTPVGGTLTLNTGLNRSVVAFTCAISFFSALFFGLAPAFRSARGAVLPALKQEGSQLTTGRSTHRMRAVLVAMQVGLSLVLLVGASLFLRSLWKLSHIDLGFTAGSVLAASVNVRLQGYSQERGQTFYADLLQRVGSVPGVSAVSLASALPVTRGGSRFQRPGPQMVPPVEGAVSVDVVTVSPHFFQTLGLPLLRGRDFGAQDTAKSTPVIIVNENLARRFWPHGDPLGQRFSGHRDITYEVVGLARDTKYRDLREAPRMTMYVPLAQSYTTGATLLVRSSGPPADLVPLLRTELRALDPAMPLFNIRTVAEHVSNALYLDRLRAVLLSIFGGLALVLAAVGIYGVVSYAVAERTREIGIRMALGASRAHVLQLMLRQAMTPVASGVLAGVVVALALTQLVASQLYGIAALDALAFGTSPVLLAGVALLAGLIPARRATRVDPMVALRYE
jgi:macrolide transport system ATP-binding/permease protein